ncbi:hypothetical protein DAPPUDRAFT_320784 [Daphnia pulex]|uniref:Uncharacterized protein n=1 Tax=Daphnia pulex TaxID=6669 RepID=E9GR30_DAPPU|nr:hypothetical protein DAPPUDRAFT_320784 [Daphnia pulex]|eukprot:EFX77938.1 hypothetical protein DAPPUDRAFT_320784 [Daphnia pulex]
MSEADDDGDFDENADPNTSHVSQSNTSSNSNPVNKLAIPAEFFTCVGDVPGKNARVYRCLHPGCVPKKKKDGSDKPLVVYHNSRHNAMRTRHFLNHDPGNQLGHTKLWEDAVKLLDNSTTLNNTATSVNRRVMISQEDLDSWVLIMKKIFVAQKLCSKENLPGFKDKTCLNLPTIQVTGPPLL